MIARLIGHLHPIGLDEVVIDVGGVGYHVMVPVGTAGRLKPLSGDDERVTVLIHTSVREDSITLFGFATPQEKAVYRKLIAVNGIGPKLGLAVLSDLDVGEVIRAVRGDDFKTFTRVSGIGKKTAQRLVLELANAFDDLPAALDIAPHVVAHSGGNGAFDDVRSALLNLEYKPNAVDAVMSELAQVAPDEEDFQALLRQALKLLR